jgi:hypothetical protein
MCYARCCQIVVFEQKRKGTPLGKSAKKFAKIYAVVIVHKVKKVEKFLTRLMLNLQEIQTFGEFRIPSMRSP